VARIWFLQTTLIMRREKLFGINQQILEVEEEDEEMVDVGEAMVAKEEEDEDKGIGIEVIVGTMKMIQPERIPGPGHGDVKDTSTGDRGEIEDTIQIQLSSKKTMVHIVCLMTNQIWKETYLLQMEVTKLVPQLLCHMILVKMKTLWQCW